MAGVIEATPNSTNQTEIDEYEIGVNLASGEQAEPLKSHSLNIHATKTDDGLKRNELINRLNRATRKLSLYEESKVTSPQLDVAIPNINDNFIGEEAKLPQHVEENIKGIVLSAQDYIAKLEEQLGDLKIADQEIENSTVKTLEEIDQTYRAFMDEICKEINKKRDLLRLETRVCKAESLVPLEACKEEIKTQIQSTRCLVNSIETMLKYPHTFNRERLAKIISASNNIGRIPAVPNLEELQYVKFYSPLNSTKEEILEKIAELGCVLRSGPAQIVDIFERPGSLFVKWVIIDPEFSGEEQMFVVQKANGEISDSASDLFKTVYQGPETCCFVKDLFVDRPVTLRVGVQGGNVVWSTHRVGKTTIPPYSWEVNNNNYIITNEGKIAGKITNVTSTLLSSGPQFDANHVIEFKFLETWHDTRDDEGIALVFEPEGHEDSLKRAGSLLITPHGKIFIDGEEKLMRLPRFRFGTKVVFNAVRKDAHSLRVNIECADKVVTYDWMVQTPLHFAARFTEYNKWNLMVK